MIKGSSVTVSIGDPETNMKTHILVTSVGHLTNMLPEGKRGADKNIFSKVNMIVFDEADEIFKVETNQTKINKIIVNHLQVELGVKPQFVLFSATVNDSIMQTIELYINSPTPTRIEASIE
jgi:superfamily II DNA/RNA helicase